MLTDYRREQWSPIFSDVLLKTLRCAFLTASITDFIACSIEALSLRVNCEQNERIIVLENLWKVFQVRFHIRYKLIKTFAENNFGLFLCRVRHPSLKVKVHLKL